MGKPYPKEFRDDVVAVARKGQASLAQAQLLALVFGQAAAYLSQANLPGK